MDKTCWMLSDVDPDDEFIVVLPACDKDCQILMRNLSWMRTLDGTIPCTCLVTQDGGMNKILAAQVLSEARATFLETLHYVYAPSKNTRWPEAPNWAFQSTAWHVHSELGKPWFWMEPDLVPLRPGWCQVLQDEYRRCGMPIMGSVVAGKTHVNGTAIYPPDFPEVSPAAMKATNVAWDWEMRDETMPLTHDAGRLMYHCWGIVNGQPHPYSGKPATFTSQDQVDKWIPAQAVTFHRCKDASLIQRLLERRKNAHHRDIRPVIPQRFSMA